MDVGGKGDAGCDEEDGKDMRDSGAADNTAGVPLQIVDDTIFQN